jgi:hypothetical protein
MKIFNVSKSRLSLIASSATYFLIFICAVYVQIAFTLFAIVLRKQTGFFFRFGGWHLARGVGKGSTTPAGLFEGARRYEVDYSTCVRIISVG